MLRTAKKLVKVCLHSSYAVQISLQFEKKFKILISLSRFEIFIKTCWDTLYYYNIVGKLSKSNRIRSSISHTFLNPPSTQICYTC